jgi:hypothetical protein
VLETNTDPLQPTDPYASYTKDNFHDKLFQLFVEHYRPEVVGIPQGVDPYLYDYALSLFLPREEYVKMEEEIGYNYLHKKDFDSSFQNFLRGPEAKMALETVMESTVGVATAPFDKAVYDLFEIDTPSCPQSKTLTSCALETLSSSLYRTRSLTKEFLKHDLPLTAWTADLKHIRKHMKLLPFYIAMRNRIYEEAIPLNSPLRWGPGNGEKSGKLKPQWVIDLQQKNQQDKKFSWMRPL